MAHGVLEFAPVGGRQIGGPGADPGIRTGSGARVSERSASGPQEDVRHNSGDGGVVVQERPDALLNGEDLLHVLDSDGWDLQINK